jgi:hypothetical protein
MGMEFEPLRAIGTVQLNRRRIDEHDFCIPDAIPLANALIVYDRNPAPTGNQNGLQSPCLLALVFTFQHLGHARQNARWRPHWIERFRCSLPG